MTERDILLSIKCKKEQIEALLADGRRDLAILNGNLGNDLRLKRGKMSRAELARRMELSASYLHGLENGRHEWTDQLVKLYNRALRQK